jgi:hypothetical protein
MKFARKSILLVSAGVLALAAASSVCAAQIPSQSPGTVSGQGSYNFDIPGQPLSQALKNFGLQASSQIMFSEDVVRGQQAPPVRGRYTSQEALAMLLKQTDLAASPQSGGMIVIERKKKDEVAPSKPGPVILAQASRPVQAPASNNGQADDIQQVVVTGTRVTTNGYQAPTPVTVVSSEQFKTLATGDAADYLNTLPQFVGSSTPVSTANGINNHQGSINGLSLRGLGTIRTLVLLNGQRIVGNIVTGVVDVYQLPQD